MSINKEKVNELLERFDEFNLKDLADITNLIQYIYRQLSYRDKFISIGEKIIKKLSELEGVSIEDSIVTTNEGKELKVKDMLDFIKKEIEEKK